MDPASAKGAQREGATLARQGQDRNDDTLVT